MRKIKFLSATTAALVSMSVVLTGCGSKTTEETKKPEEAKLDATQEINVVGTEPSSYDPNKCSDSESFTVFAQVYEGLYREVQDGKATKLIPALAKEAAKKSADGLTYTFTLRDDAKWSDGKAVTAKDLEFSWKRLIDPATAADYANFIDMVKGAEAYRNGKGKIEDVGIKAKDDKTFEVTLAYPCPYFEKLLAFRCLVPLREDVVKAQGDKFGSDFKTIPYNGPFVVEDYQKKSKIVYKKNDQYWGAKDVKLTKINGIINDEPTTLVKMFTAGQLDAVGATGPDLETLKKDAEAGKYTLYKGDEPSVFYYLFNMGSKGNPVLKNAKVREALALSFDRQQQLDVVWKRYTAGTGIVAKGVTFDGKQYRDLVEEPLKSVIAGKPDAKAMFAEGLKAAGGETDPSKVTLKLLMSANSSTNQKIVGFIQKQLQDNLGIKVEAKFSVDSPSYFKDRKDGNFDLCLGGWSSDYDDVSSFFSLFRSTDANNGSKYSNAEFDKLVADADKETDSAKRLEMYKKAEKIITVDDPGLATCFYRDIFSFRQNYVKNYFMPNYGGNYELRDAYIQGKESK